jgi:histidinol-phosphate/aromatic aminotransferase/cobyric acid decarboxylase-like protein/choline kinase
MKAIILAAGYGNRMRPLTDSCHKTMLKVAGKTIICRIIDGLVENGIEDIVVVTGYRADELTEHLRECYPQLSFQFIHNSKYRETNNIYSMALAFEHISIDNDIILIESDLLYHPEVIRRLINSPYKNAALVDKYKIGMDGTVVTVENSVITNVIPPHLQSESFDFSDKYKTLNIYKFSREFCNTSFKKLLIYYANVIDRNCYYELILGILIYMQKETIHAEIVQGENWSEVDDPNDLQVAEFDFNENRKEILEYAFGGYWNYHFTDFCFIRNMHFPNASIISEMKNVLADLMHNYGSRQALLDRKMAWFLLCDESRITALNGASQIYPILRSRFGNSSALIPCPSFGEYSRIFDKFNTYKDDGDFDITEIQHKAMDADCIVFVNPNNPTGTLLNTDWIYSFAATFPDKKILVDESFIEFSEFSSIITALEEKPLTNIMVIKSLSKSLGVPGIRLGYFYCCDQGMNTYVKQNIPIWNMNSIAEHFLELILKHRNTLSSSFEQTIRDRTDFAAELSTIPYIDRVYKSGANFLLVRLKGNADFAHQLSSYLLSEKSIFVKDISSKFSDGAGYFRLAVRLQSENRALVNHLLSVEPDFAGISDNELVSN